MKLFKRFEVWALLVFVLAGVGFVLFTHKAEDLLEDDPAVAVIDNNSGQPPIAGTADPDPESTPVSPKPKAAFAIETVKLDPSGAANWLLELQVRYRNETGADLELTSPNAQLLTADGDEVPSFFLAFAPPPVAPAKSEQLLDLRYWLDEPRRGGKLELKILDERVPIALNSPDDGKVVRDRNDEGHADDS